MWLTLSYPVVCVCDSSITLPSERWHRRVNMCYISRLRPLRSKLQAGQLTSESFLTVNFPLVVFECYSQKAGPESPGVLLPRITTHRCLTTDTFPVMNVPYGLTGSRHFSGGACSPKVRANFQINQTFLKFPVLQFSS